VLNTTATARVLPSEVVGMGRRANAAFWGASHISLFLGCCRLVVVAVSVMGGRMEGDLEILERGWQHPRPDGRRYLQER